MSGLGRRGEGRVMGLCVCAGTGEGSRLLLRAWMAKAGPPVPARKPPSGSEASESTGLPAASVCDVV